MIKLSVLDQTPVSSGRTPADAVNETIKLAQAAERLGYTRYWLAEHHATDGFAGSAPEIMVTRVAEATKHMRVGSGGVMLSHYSPLKVAEQFRLLETMYPGRIDLGIGRAPGSDQLTAHALAYGSQIGVEYFPNRIADLAAFVTGTQPPTEALARVKATPAPPSNPALWLLGSSPQSGIYASTYGLAYSFAHFINPMGGAEVMRDYRTQFEPSGLLDEPLGSVGVFVICAETQAEADELNLSRDLFRIRLEYGHLDPYPSVEEAKAYEFSPQEQVRVGHNRELAIVGTPETVKARLEELAAVYMVDELILLTICHDFGARLRSYELLAEAFGLKELG